MRINYQQLRMAALSVASIAAPVLVSAPSASAAPPSAQKTFQLDRTTIGSVRRDGATVYCDTTDANAVTEIFPDRQRTMTTLRAGTPTEVNVFSDYDSKGVLKGLKRFMLRDGHEIMSTDGVKVIPVSDPATLKRDKDFKATGPAECKVMQEKFRTDPSRFPRKTSPTPG